MATLDGAASGGLLATAVHAARRPDREGHGAVTQALQREHERRGGVALPLDALGAGGRADGELAGDLGLGGLGDIPVEGVHAAKATQLRSPRQGEVRTCEGAGCQRCGVGKHLDDDAIRERIRAWLRWYFDRECAADEDMTQRKFAKKLGLSETHVSEVLSGSRPPAMRVVGALRSALHADMNEVLDLPPPASRAEDSPGPAKASPSTVRPARRRAGGTGH